MEALVIRILEEGFCVYKDSCFSSRFASLPHAPTLIPVLVSFVSFVLFLVPLVGHSVPSLSLPMISLSCYKGE